METIALNSLLALAIGIRYLRWVLWVQTVHSTLEFLSMTVICVRFMFVCEVPHDTETFIPNAKTKFFFKIRTLF